MSPLSMASRIARIGGPCAFGSHVALGGEAGHEVIARGAHGEQRPLRHRFLHGLQILIARMQEQVHVRIDESRHQGRGAQIDDFGPWTVFDRGTHRDDSIALDAHLAGRLETARLDVEEVGGAQDDGMTAARLREGAFHMSEEDQGQRATSSRFHDSSSLSRRA